MLAVIEKARKDYCRRKTWIHLWIDSGNLTNGENSIAMEIFWFCEIDSRPEIYLGRSSTME